MPTGRPFQLLDVLEGLFQLWLQRINSVRQTCEFLVCRLFLEEDFGIELRRDGPADVPTRNPSGEVEYNR